MAGAVAAVGKKYIMKAIKAKLRVVMTPVVTLLVLFTVITLALFGGADQLAQAAQQCNTAVTAGSYAPLADGKGPNQSIIDIVYAVGKQRGVSDKGMLAAFETAIVESPNFTNPASKAVPESESYPHDYVAKGDHDSVGVFQQRVGGSGRDGKPWGTVQQIMDPSWSAGRFFDSLAVMEPKRPGVTAGQLAQAVQVSAFPDRYDQEEAKAKQYLQEAAARAANTAAVPPATGATPGQNSLGIKQIAGAKWVWPAAEDKITSGYGARWGDIHEGLDFGVPIGTPVVAAMSGTVVRSATSKSYGEVIYLDNGGGVQTRYAHGSQRLVQVGATVTAGQTILMSGNTGQSTGPHLHFEVRQGNASSLDNSTKSQDPAPFLKSNGAIIASGDPAAGAAGGTAVCSSVDGALTDPGVGPMNENNYTPRAQNIFDITNTRWGCDTGVSPCVKSIGGFRKGGPNKVSDHHTGNAVDIMVGKPATRAGGADKALGDVIAKFYTENAASLGIQYIIWYGQYWDVDDGNWVKYTGGSDAKNVNDPTIGHYDHVHISVKTS